MTTPAQTRTTKVSIGPPVEPMLASSGLDIDAPQPVGVDVISIPPEADAQPTPQAAAVSFAPPMSVEAPMPVSVPVPMAMSAADDFNISQQLAAMRAELQRLSAKNQALESYNAALIDTAQTALTRGPTNTIVEPPPPAAPEYKLYFVGRRLEPADAATGMPAYDTIDLRGGVHTCSRLGGAEHLVFGASREDQRPHAFVNRADGEWLLAFDCKKDRYGTPVEVRYQWSPEALRAFAELPVLQVA